MENEKNMPDPVPFIIYEGTMVRFERIVKRLIICLVIAIILLFVSNGAWLYAWMQYDYESSETQTIRVDGKDGNANFVNKGGSIVNGEDNNKNGEETKKN